MDDTAPPAAVDAPDAEATGAAAAAAAAEAVGAAAEAAGAAEAHTFSSRRAAADEAGVAARATCRGPPLACLALARGGCLLALGAAPAAQDKAAAPVAPATPTPKAAAHTAAASGLPCRAEAGRLLGAARSTTRALSSGSSSSARRGAKAAVEDDSPSSCPARTTLADIGRCRRRGRHTWSCCCCCCCCCPGAGPAASAPTGAPSARCSAGPSGSPSACCPAGPRAAALRPASSTRASRAARPARLCSASSRSSARVRASYCAGSAASSPGCGRTIKPPSRPAPRSSNSTAPSPRRCLPLALRRCAAHAQAALVARRRRGDRPAQQQPAGAEARQAAPAPNVTPGRP